MCLWYKYPIDVIILVTMEGHADTFVVDGAVAGSSGQQQEQEQGQQYTYGGSIEKKQPRCKDQGGGHGMKMMNDQKEDGVLDNTIVSRRHSHNNHSHNKHSSSRDDVESFLRMMLASVASLHDRLDRSIHMVSEVPMDELDGFVEKEKVMLETWCSERIKEFDTVTLERE